MHERKPHEGRLKADVTGAAAFVSDLPIPAGDVLLVSDTGTGKTSWAAGQGITTSITHRVALSDALAQALDTENYKGLTVAQLRQIPRLTICLNSLYKVPERKPGVLFIDEIQQLLTHLGGDTFKAAQAETAFNILESQITQADRVIAADADVRPEVIDFLKALRPGLQVIVNTQARQRGPLTVHKYKGGAIATAWALADENSGPVVIATGSKELAKDLSDIAADRYGEPAVMTIHQDVSNEPDVKYFLRNINTQISEYRVVIYSPTVGSGIDIQTPVRAVVGLFLAEPLTAPECHQMINRCRHAQDVHVYIEAKEGSRETDPDVIYRNAIENAIQTGHVAHFDAHGVQVTTPAQERLQRLLARIEAADNASKNDLFNHFLQLARGYSSTTFSEANNRAALETTQQQRTDRREADKQRTLTAAPVSRAAYDALMEAGELTQADRYGFLRWRIERAAGADITDVNYDLLHTPQGRAKLYFLTDCLHEQFDMLTELDRLDAEALPGKRKHRARRVALEKDLIKRVFGRDGLQADKVLELPEIIEAVNDFLAVSGDEVKRLFNRRSDLSDQPVPFLRWMLARLGLRLESKQLGKGDTRRRVYFLSADSLKTMLALAQSSYARRYADRQQALKTDGVTQNVYESYPNLHELSNPEPDNPPPLPYIGILARPTLFSPGVRGVMA